jgi:hypothetical protein
VEFNPAVVNSYHLIGYDNRILDAQDFKDDTKDAGEVGSGAEVVVLYELVMEGSENSVDLKYQNNDKKQATSGEICTVKTRYKEPNGIMSKEESFAVQPSVIGKTDKRFDFASAIAEFGLVLRGSKYKGSADLNHALSVATASADDEYKQDFVEMLTALIRQSNNSSGSYYEEPVEEPYYNPNTELTENPYYDSNSEPVENVYPSNPNTPNQSEYQTNIQQGANDYSWGN